MKFKLKFAEEEKTFGQEPQKKNSSGSLFNRAYESVSVPHREEVALESGRDRLEDQGAPKEQCNRHEPPQTGLRVATPYTTTKSHPPI